MACNRLALFIRIRPPSAVEASQQDYASIFEETADDHVVVRGGRTYSCDGLLTTQNDAFERVGVPALDLALDGYTAGVMCYGQTGTGKTYTMCNDSLDKNEQGLVPRIAQQLFSQLSQHRTTLCTLQVVQIYRDVLQDLLADCEGTVVETSQTPNDVDEVKNNMPSEKVGLRYAPENGVELIGVRALSVDSAAEFMRCFRYAIAKRATCSTKMNATSSRSHVAVICRLSHESDSDASVQVNGKLLLVDLAGYERFTKTDVTEEKHKDEARTINASLLSLGNVVQALSEKQQHVPWRNSKLTRLMQDCVGGRSQTAVVLTVCATDEHYHETMGTLFFGSRAMNVATSTQKEVVVDYEQRSIKLQKLLSDAAKRIDDLEQQKAVKDLQIEEMERKMHNEIASLQNEQIECLERMMHNGEAPERIRELIKAYNVEIETRLEQHQEERILFDEEVVGSATKTFQERQNEWSREKTELCEEYTTVLSTAEEDNVNLRHTLKEQSERILSLENETNGMKADLAVLSLDLNMEKSSNAELTRQITALQEENEQLRSALLKERSDAGDVRPQQQQEQQQLRFSSIRDRLFNAQFMRRCMIELDEAHEFSAAVIALAGTVIKNAAPSSAIAASDFLGCVQDVSRGLARIQLLLDETVEDKEDFVAKSIEKLLKQFERTETDPASHQGLPRESAPSEENASESKLSSLRKRPESHRMLLLSTRSTEGDRKRSEGQVLPSIRADSVHQESKKWGLDNLQAYRTLAAYKLIVLGDGNVGKSSLIACCTNKTPRWLKTAPKVEMPTLAIRFTHFVYDVVVPSCDVPVGGVCDRVPDVAVMLRKGPISCPYHVDFVEEPSMALRANATALFPWRGSAYILVYDMTAPIVSTRKTLLKLIRQVLAGCSCGVLRAFQGHEPPKSSPSPQGASQSAANDKSSVLLPFVFIGTHQDKTLKEDDTAVQASLRELRDWFRLSSQKLASDEFARSGGRTDEFPSSIPHLEPYLLDSYAVSCDKWTVVGERPGCADTFDGIAKGVVQFLSVHSPIAPYHFLRSPTSPLPSHFTARTEAPVAVDNTWALVREHADASPFDRAVYGVVTTITTLQRFCDWAAFATDASIMTDLIRQHIGAGKTATTETNIEAVHWVRQISIACASRGLLTWLDTTEECRICTIGPYWVVNALNQIILPAVVSEAIIRVPSSSKSVSSRVKTQYQLDLEDTIVARELRKYHCGYVSLPLLRVLLSPPLDALVSTLETTLVALSALNISRTSLSTVDRAPRSIVPIPPQTQQSPEGKEARTARDIGACFVPFLARPVSSRVCNYVAFVMSSVGDELIDGVMQVSCCPASLFSDVCQALAADDESSDVFLWQNAVCLSWKFSTWLMIVESEAQDGCYRVCLTCPTTLPATATYNDLFGVLVHIFERETAKYAACSCSSHFDIVLPPLQPWEQVEFQAREFLSATQRRDVTNREIDILKKLVDHASPSSTLDECIQLIDGLL